MPRYRYTRWRWHLAFTALDALGWLAVWLARAAAIPLRLFLKPREAGRLWPPRSILVIQLDHLGDAVLSTGLLAALREQFPSASLEVLTGDWNEELFSACPEVDHLHVSRCNRFARRGRFGWPLAILAWGRRLRRRRFDVAIDVRGEFPHAVLMWLAGARRRIGWDAGGGGFLLTDSPPYVPGRHEVLSRAALLKRLVDGESAAGRAREAVPKASSVDFSPRHRRAGAVDGGPADLPLIPAPHFVPPIEAAEHVSRRLDGWRDPVRPLVVLHVGSGMPAKRWPVEHWRELLGRLVLERNAQVVLVGSAEEAASWRAVAGAAPWPGVTDWSGQLTVPQLAALLQQADLFVGADSGPAHLASAVATHVVALFSGTNLAEQWRPWGEGVAVVRSPIACAPCHRRQCPFADHPCMRRLHPADVWEAVERFLPPTGDLAAEGSRLLSSAAQHGLGRKNRLDPQGASTMEGSLPLVARNT